MKRESIGAQGEIMLFRVSEMPSGLFPMAQRDKAGRPVISHSESGHHHVLDRPVDVLEKSDPPAGMRILYAILDEPTALIQSADQPHGQHHLPPGIYEFRIAREFDPFSDQARMVAD